MKLRALIFDIYGTLLEVGPPPADARERWESLWDRGLKSTPRLSIEEFSAACQRRIDGEHHQARARGIAHPEVYWPDVVNAVLSEFVPLPEPELSVFCFGHAQIVRTVRLMPGAAEALRRLDARPLRLGLASNSQPYTLRELERALGETGLSRDLFTPSLCFFSFEQGFSKPDPHVFQMLTARLRGFGIATEEAMMVGDRVDNDIAPARAHGWQTWWLTPEERSPTRDAGTWRELVSRLAPPE